MSFIKNIVQKPYVLVIIPIYHTILQLSYLISANLNYIVKSIIGSTFLFGLAVILGYYQSTLECLQWIGLGILSSIGFGFGFHTFVLFLAPHIAAVTMAAQSCKSLNFPSPPYPKEIICPSDQAFANITFSQILVKVALESFMWGLGTAIGELPPYLAARIAKSQSIVHNASGDNQDIHTNSNHQSIGSKIENLMIKTIKRVGFIGILLCAAIPNPLFDAAGIASGIAQVPFISFFGATFIGKAILKVLIQASFVIFLFHNNNLDKFLYVIHENLSDLIPGYKSLNLYSLIVSFLEQKRESVLRKQTGDDIDLTSWSTSLYNWFILCMALLFVTSFIGALDKQYKERTATKTSVKTD